MLGIFFGTDRKTVRDEAANFLSTAVPHVAADTIDATNYQPGQLPNLASAQSLFGGVEAYILDTPSADSEFETEVQEHLAQLAASENVFVILESRLLVAAKKKYEKHAETTKECNAEKADRFNAFSLAEALAKRDKKNLWVLLQEAQLAGLRPEEIVGMLWWQLKAIRLAGLTRSAEEAGMKEYPYRKAKSALNKYQPEEAALLASSLLSLYHQSHQGKADMDLQLENWCLSI
jgi:DNA polymerase III delta subunit